MRHGRAVPVLALPDCKWLLLTSACEMCAVVQDGDASNDATYGNIHMAGQEVFKFAVRSVPAVIEAALEQAKLGKEDIDWLVMHQANQRILDAAAQRLKLPPERVSLAWWPLIQ